MSQAIRDAVTSGYKADQPLWMAYPAESAFCIMSKWEFQNMGEHEVQALFRQKHVVIHDQFEPTLAFDENGLKTLGDLFKTMTIHGS